jgi:hypothetical protein
LIEWHGAEAGGAFAFDEAEDEVISDDAEGVGAEAAEGREEGDGERWDGVRVGLGVALPELRLEGGGDEASESGGTGFYEVEGFVIGERCGEVVLPEGDATLDGLCPATDPRAAIIEPALEGGAEGGFFDEGVPSMGEHSLKGRVRGG